MIIIRLFLNLILIFILLKVGVWIVFNLSTIFAFLVTIALLISVIILILLPTIFVLMILG